MSVIAVRLLVFLKDPTDEHWEIVPDTSNEFPRLLHSLFCHSSHNGEDSHFRGPIPATMMFSMVYSQPPWWMHSKRCVPVELVVLPLARVMEDLISMGALLERSSAWLYSLTVSRSIAWIAPAVVLVYASVSRRTGCRYGHGYRYEYGELGETRRSLSMFMAECNQCSGGPTGNGVVIEVLHVYLGKNWERLFVKNGICFKRISKSSQTMSWN